MKLARPMLAHLHSGLPEDQRLITAYNSLWPKFYQQALTSVSKLHSGAAHITGTILVASAADAHGPARIHMLDFATGKVSQSSNSIEADGQNPTMFATNARALMSTLRQANRLFPLDQWGIKCVEDAVLAYPQNVGWPVDLILSRSVVGSARITLMRRVLPGSASALLEFQI
jgi:hypothetical protein